MIVEIILIFALFIALSIDFAELVSVENKILNFILWMISPVLVILLGVLIFVYASPIAFLIAFGGLTLYGFNLFAGEFNFFNLYSLRDSERDLMYLFSVSVISFVIFVGKVSVMLFA